MTGPRVTFAEDPSAAPAAERDDDHAVDDDPEEAEEYVRFSAQHFLSAPTTVAAAPARSQYELPEEVSNVVYDVDPERYDSWESYCNWCLGAGRAEGVFVMDERGRIIASSGTAANIATGKLGRWLREPLVLGPTTVPFDDPPRSLAVQFETSWVTALRIAGERPDADRGETHVVGLITVEPLFHDARRAIVTQGCYTLQYC